MESTHAEGACNHDGRLDAEFSHPFDQTTYLDSYTVDVILETSPEGSEIDIYIYDGFLSNNGNGTAYFKFRYASPGTYSGRMRLEVGEECQYIELPFEFAVQPIEDLEVVSDVIWSSVGGSDSTCLSSGSTSATFLHGKGAYLYLDEQTIDFEWTNILDSSTLNIYSYGGVLYDDSFGTAEFFDNASPETTPVPCSSGTRTSARPTRFRFCFLSSSQLPFTF